MFEHTVTFTDFNGKEQTELLRFHMSSPDMMDLQFNPEIEGDMASWVTSMMSEGEGRKVWIFFKLLVVNSYGRRSADGAKFSKRAEFTQDFMDSGAWDKFFEWLLLDSPDGKNAKEFWEGIIPERIRKEAAEIEAKAAAAGGEKKRKLSDMTQEELVALVQAKVADPKVIDA